MDEFDFSIFDVQFTDAGIIAPSTSTIKTGWQELFKIIFGNDISLDDASPQGMLITSLTRVIVNKNANFIYLANQFNPNNSSENFQDAIGQLYYIARKPATSSYVMCECRGLPGTVLNGQNEAEPAQAISTNGDIFTCVNTVEIPNSGIINAQFASVEKGIIPVNANSVNSIYRQIPGWDSVNNPSVGVVGTVVENRLEFEERRKNSIAINAQGNKEEVKARVSTLENVTACNVLENDSSVSVIEKGCELTRNSIYVVVQGTESEENIATAIKKSKSAGCATNGSQSVMLDGNIIPIKFDYVEPVSVYVKVIVNNHNLPSDYVTQVQNAVISNLNGADGTTRISIGDTLYASRFYCSLNLLSFNTVSIKVGLDGENWEDFLNFNANQIAQISTENILVSINV